MTYEQYEESVEGSQPVEIYTIILGATTYKYTSAEDDVTVNANTYNAIAISRSKIGRGQDSRKNTLEIKVPGNNPIAIQYISNVPGQRGYVLVQRYQRSDGSSPEIINIFEGKLSRVEFIDDAKIAKITVTPISAAISRQIPRYVFSAQCNNILFDDNCGISKTNPLYWYQGTISAVSDNIITVSGLGSTHSSGWANAGVVEILSGSDSRLVTNHTGDNLELLLPFPVNILGSTVDVYAGCGHSIAVCKTDFDNVINFKGCAFVPHRNIFESGLV